MPDPPAQTPAIGQIGDRSDRGLPIGPASTVNGEEADLYGNYFVAEDMALYTEG